MGLKDQILADIKTAMKARDSQKLTTLRFVNAAFKNKEIDVRPNELTEADCLAVLKKLGKQHRDSIEQYQKAERADLVEKEQAELAIVELYLPEQMSKEKIEEVVIEVIKETGATDMKQMGLVIKAVGEKTAGAADNKVVSQIVREKLQ